MTDSYCKVARSDISDALHGQLSDDAEHRLREHLEICADCRRFEQAERVLNQTLARLPARTAPSSLKARLASTLDAGSALRESTTRKPQHRLWLAAAAVAILGVVGWGTLRNNNGSNRLVAEAVNDHLRVLYAERPLEVESGGIHQVKPWFEGRLDFAPALGFEGNDEFVLTGGSVGYFIDRKAAVFVFKRRLHVITLFEFRADGLPWPPISNKSLGRLSALEAQSRGFGALIFHDGDLGYALVSDVDPTTLERLGSEIVKAGPSRP